MQIIHNNKEFQYRKIKGLTILAKGIDILNKTREEYILLYNGKRLM